MTTGPALPALIAVCLGLLAAPFPWAGSGGLPPSVPPAVAAAAAVEPPGWPEPPAPSAGRVGPRFGPLPLVVGPELGRAGTSSAGSGPGGSGPGGSGPGGSGPGGSGPGGSGAGGAGAGGAGAGGAGERRPRLGRVVPPAVVPAPPGAVPPPVAALPATPAPVAAAVPTVEVDPAGGEWLRRRAADALALVAYPWRELGYDVAFGTARPGLRARTLLHERRIEVHARPGDPARQTAFDLAHEVAHAFDFERGTWAARSRWRQARGIDPALAWFGCNACTDLSTPAGDFAESFAAWQVPGGAFRSTLGPPPDVAQRALLAELTAP